MYNGGGRSQPRPLMGISTTPQNLPVKITNLDYGVTDNDIRVSVLVYIVLINFIA